MSSTSLERARWSTKQALTACVLVAGGLALTSCTSDGATTASGGGGGGGGAPVDDAVNFDTAEFSVAPGQELYMCYTMHTTEDLAIDRFTYEAQPGIHHLLLANTVVAEDDKPFECNVLFKQTWFPIFANGTGSADVSTPEGSAFKIHKGSQLLVQLHLLNSGKETIKGTGRLAMHKNTSPDLVGAGIYGFGTQNVVLPAQKVTTLQNDCAIDKDVHIFSGFPHMHTLGKKMSFWTGKDEASLTKQFSIDAWSFGEQQIVPLKLDLPKGTMTRVTCEYDNTTPNEVTFGESTSNEMCYFTTFIAPFETLDGCVDLQ
jgi:copper type II ascorbate-dependent monooxygenase-like protein